MQSSPDILAKGDLVEVSKEELFKDPNVLNSDLLHAIDSNDENKVKEALHNGAKADFILTESHKPNWSGWSILAYTVYFNKINLTKILLEEYPSPNPIQKIKNGFWAGWTLLNYALYQQYVEIAYLLIEKGAYANQNDRIQGWPLIAYAVYYNMQDIVEILLKEGANANELIPNDSILNDGAWAGWNLLAYALYKKYDFCASKLLLSGAKVKTNEIEEKFPGGIGGAWGYENWTYLAYAVYFKMTDYDIIKTLIIRGAKSNNKFISGFSLRGKTFIEYATQKGWKNVAEMLTNLPQQPNPLIQPAPPKKQLARGQCYYPELINSNYFLIDKSLFIKTIIDDPNKIKIFTRPSGCGKTLILSMLDWFFSKEYNIPDEHIKDLKINHENSNLVNEHKNKYTIINISLKNIATDDHKETIKNFKRIIFNLYGKFYNQIKNHNEEFINYLEKFKEEKLSDDELKITLGKLVLSINKNDPDSKIIILIDEYDALYHRLLIETNSEKRKNIINTADFIMTCIDNALKLENSFYQVICMGIFPLSLEQDFIKNAQHYPISSQDSYTDFFGFTKEDINSLLEDQLEFNEKNQIDSMYEWCKIYTKKISLYNPSLVTAFLDKALSHKNPAVFLSAKEVLEFILSRVISNNSIIKENCKKLLTAENFYIESKILPTIELDIEFKNENEKNYIWNILLACGFLSIDFDNTIGVFTSTLTIANKSSSQLYENALLKSKSNYIENITNENKVNKQTDAASSSYSKKITNKNTQSYDFNKSSKKSFKDALQTTATKSLEKNSFFNKNKKSSVNKKNVPSQSNQYKSR